MLLVKPNSPPATEPYEPGLQMVPVVGAGTSESSSAHRTSMLGGAMPWGSDIAFSFCLPEHAHSQ
jgi:hypothetical protein